MSFTPEEAPVEDKKHKKKSKKSKPSPAADATCEESVVADGMKEKSKKRKHDEASTLSGMFVHFSISVWI